MLDTLIPVQIPYPIRGAIIRGVRTFIAIVLAGVSASIADGSIIAGITVIPPEYKPAVIVFLTTVFVGIDKWLRERDLVGDVPDEPLTDEGHDETPVPEPEPTPEPEPAPEPAPPAPSTDVDDGLLGETDVPDGV